MHPQRLAGFSLRLLIIASAGIAFSAAASPQLPQIDDHIARLAEISGLEPHFAPPDPGCVSAGAGVNLCEPRRERTSARDFAARAAAMTTLNEHGLLLIPNSTDKRIMAFDPISGDLIDGSFIELDDDATGTAIHAIRAANGNILVSDQTRDVVHEYTLAGDYLGVFAPAGGVDNAILDNIRGMALRPGGNLLVTVGAGANAHAVAEFDAAGNHVGNFIANGSGGLDSPYDVYERPSSDWLVSSINSNEVLRFAHADAAPLGQFAAVSSFPQQIFAMDNGNVLVANFSGTQGVYEFTQAGVQIGVYNPAGVIGYRGVYPLPNGNILTSTSGGVYEIDRLDNLVDTKHTGQSRFIEFLPPPAFQHFVTVGLEPDEPDEDFCPQTNQVVTTPGTPVRFCYRVTNNTGTTLSRHDLESDTLGLILDGLPLNLTSGQSVFLWQTHVPTGETVESATWTAYNPGPVDVHAATDTAMVLMIPEIFADGFESIE
jgi:hypothetical protein